MTPLKLVVALSALSAASHAMAWDYVLLDTDKAAQNWQITCLLYTSPSPRDS